MQDVLRVTRDGDLARVTLNRPDRNNAFDETLIAALREAFETLANDRSVSIVLLSGEGKSLCAGADINWMRKAATYTREENIRDAEPLARMLAALDAMPQTTIARVTGPIYGGGVGLVAACDIAIAASDATFCLSEVRLGIVPATIGPYVVRAIGARRARRYFQSAEVFDDLTARDIGLVHECVDSDELDFRIAELVKQLLTAAPGARAAAKALVRRIDGRPIDETLIMETVELIADMRAKPEAKEGLSAFLDKRKPMWGRA